MFDTPGADNYMCLVHVDRMFGTIEVVLEDQDADSQEAISRRPRAEIAAKMALTGPARDVAQMTKKEPGPNNTTISYVRAGMTNVFPGGQPFLRENPR